MSGSTVDAALISGLPNPGGLALDGIGGLYVSTYDHVGRYTTSGGALNASLISGGYNTATGSGALYSNTSGDLNTVSGWNAMSTNSSGAQNCAFGAQSLNSNTGGVANVAIGMRSLFSNTIGKYNIAVGFDALKLNTTSEQNIAIGAYALSSQSYSNNNVQYTSGNVAIGFQALSTNQPTNAGTGNYNTAVGDLSLTSNTNGLDNTAIGASTLFKNTSGYSNTAVGRQSLYNTTTGSHNTSIGFKALNNNNTGGFNTASGSFALFSNSNGEYNVAAGYNALYNNTSGLYNIGMGFNAMYLNAIGNLNVGLGYNCTLDFNNSSNNTLVGASSRIAGVNDVAIGYLSYTNVNNLALLGSTTTAQIGGYANWSNFSDGRFKTRVDENVKGLDFILRLRPVTYHMNVRAIYKLWNISPYGNNDSLLTADMKKLIDDAIENKEATRMSGFIAQEVEKAAIQTGYDFDGVIKPAHSKDHYRIAYGEFVVPIVKAIQDQQQIIVLQADEIKKMNEKITSLTRLVEEITHK